MEGWSTLNEGSDLYQDEIVETFKSRNKSSFDLDSSVKHGNVDDCSERLKGLFDQVLLVFLREVSGKKRVRPIPALLGNGQPADLFKLFLVVWKRGGYDSVSRNRKWGCVIAECGFDWGMMACVKLVYLKYLNELDQWLRWAFKDERLGSGEGEIDEKLGILLLELQEEFKGLLYNGRDAKRKQNGKYDDLGVAKRELTFPAARDINEVYDNAEKSPKHIDDDEKFCANDENNVVVLDTTVAMQVYTSQKRKRESLSLLGMLNWVTDVAKHSNDPAIGRIPDTSKWKDYSSKELWVQALLAREVLLTRRNVNLNAEESLLQVGVQEGVLWMGREQLPLHGLNFRAKRTVNQSSGPISFQGCWLNPRRKWSLLIAYDWGWLGSCLDKSAAMLRWLSKWIKYPCRMFDTLVMKKLKMHPSMYDDTDVLNHRSAEGLRCSERLPSLTKPRFCPCCNSCSAFPTKVVTPRKVEVVNNPKEQAPPSAKIMGTNAIVGMPNDEPFQKHVSVGPLFQAEVPEWTGVVPDSDSKWLGTMMWPPPQNGKHNSPVEMDPIGKGRRDSCSCQLPGSVRCIRFHIAEKRMKLKLELGSLFYHWRFDRMGEEVSLSWTIAEEKRFKDMIRLKPPSLNKFFWDIQVLKFFPTKTREQLVSYYFNVFLVRCRTYQNRVTPKDIDSDDDESEFGCIGGSYGYEALNVPSPKLPMCTENKQCIDL
ncbi:ARID/BRIGHT DNA-binding, ELM2 domain and myb-like DNA-binding domain-containing protein [Actinidia rufa]|uniref:ARID/BRIGHT DNA-binding, ELM2 domain and myb-like DNA-binding domain-containing protein n=1 Tax=Actinidia rufa TaxID=165716 RepID=A0A7J0FRL3_9ERIC|nr:ARID/BRIGHT DNA-binding, ELM2 domain and myb-like DNA-binding domain-containing protein [Actinidia rufa]